jgi:hypothetical protein
LVPLEDNELRITTDESVAGPFQIGFSEEVFEMGEQESRVFWLRRD